MPTSRSNNILPDNLLKVIKMPKMFKFFGKDKDDSKLVVDAVPVGSTGGTHRPLLESQSSDISVPYTVNEDDPISRISSDDRQVEQFNGSVSPTNDISTSVNQHNMTVQKVETQNVFKISGSKYIHFGPTFRIGSEQKTQKKQKERKRTPTIDGKYLKNKKKLETVMATL